MTDRFVALDVETANADLASICQIGVVKFAAGDVQDSWSTLVDPEDYFDPVNTSIHGIDESKIAGAPRFPDVIARLSEWTTGQIVVSHMAFDRVALGRVCEKYRLTPIDCTWLESARVCRRAWEQFATRGYGLKNVASWCGIEFNHHDAEEDARAAGMIVLRAIEDANLSISEWVDRARRPISSSGSGGGKSESVKRTGDPDGPLTGEVVVFTGALNLPRRQAADMAAGAGCDVATTVGMKTTLLVVGDQDLRKLGGHEKSSKHRKAEEKIVAGQPIRILGESDFMAVVRQE